LYTVVDPEGSSPVAVSLNEVAPDLWHLKCILRPKVGEVVDTLLDAYFTTKGLKAVHSLAHEAIRKLS